MKKRNKDNELAVIEILRSTGIDILEAALIAKRALEAGRGRVKRTLRCIAAGEQELRRQQRTVTFARAVDEALKARADLRKRTRTDFRYISQRLIKYCPGLAQRKVRCITAAECEAYLRKAFCTPRQRNKARLILSGIFATACKQGWCSRNPARELAPEKIEEKRIRILSHEEISRLLHTAATHEGGICLAAVALMLYAGIRPHEVERLHWKDVHMDSGVICISPGTTKPAGPAASPFTRRWQKSSPRCRKTTKSRFARQIGANAGQSCTGRPAFMYGSRMCCATPSLRTTWPPSAAMLSCRSRWGTALPSCYAHAT